MAAVDDWSYAPNTPSSPILELPLDNGMSNYNGRVLRVEQMADAMRYVRFGKPIVKGSNDSNIIVPLDLNDQPLMFEITWLKAPFGIETVLKGDEPARFNMCLNVPDRDEDMSTALINMDVAIKQHAPNCVSSKFSDIDVNYLSVLRTRANANRPRTLRLCLPISSADRTVMFQVFEYGDSTPLDVCDLENTIPRYSMVRAVCHLSNVFVSNDKWGATIRAVQVEYKPPAFLASRRLFIS